MLKTDALSRNRFSAGRTLAIVAILFCTQANADQLPDWQLDGLEAALRDPLEGVLPVTIRLSDGALLAAFNQARADAVIPLLVERLSSEEDAVRLAAAQALGGLGEHAKGQAAQLVALLSNEDFEVQQAAAQALGVLGEHAKGQAAQLGALLSAEDSGVQQAAARALGRLGEHAKGQVAQLVSELGNKNDQTASEVARVLVSLGPTAFAELPSILEISYDQRQLREEIRFYSIFSSGGNEKVVRLLRWLARPKEVPYSETANRTDLAVETLELFDEIWPHIDGYPLVRNDLERVIAKVIDNGSWILENKPLLARHSENLRAAGSTHVAIVERAIDRIEVRSWATLAIITVLLHLIFWCLLVFVYPRWPAVQAFFFWNKWTRRFAGFGYVGVLLAWVPYLRRRLFMPFSDSLLADARLDEFAEMAYFSQSKVRLRRLGSDAELVTALCDRPGQIILEGESGLGKSMFLRHKIRHARRLVVFLPATKCDGGVLQAIQAKLEGPARDEVYLRSLIFAGSLDVIIDGLNEVSSDTRAKVIQFAESFFKGNLLLASQPMVWQPPPLAKVYVLQPLEEDQIERFLGSRVPPSTAGEALDIGEYEKRCQEFIGSLSLDTMSEERRKANLRVLSNPMDLSVVSLMLAHGQSPDLFSLQKQHYGIMADDYRRRNSNQEFPLAAFCERTYEMRLNETLTFAADEFGNELAVMADHKMVIPYQEVSVDADVSPRWTFRHDKVMDFFLVHAFTGEDNERPKEHLGDAQFRGTYLQLATLLSLREAETLERLLIEHAADSKDHSVSDEFVKLLRGRRGDASAKVSERRALDAVG